MLGCRGTVAWAQASSDTALLYSCKLPFAPRTGTENYRWNERSTIRQDQTRVDEYNHPLVFLSSDQYQNAGVVPVGSAGRVYRRSEFMI